MSAARVAVATALAIALAGSPAWGHTFPPVHTVVVQVERCEVALLVGYTAGSGEPTERIVARAASEPKSLMVGTLRDTLAAYAMAPISVAFDGVPLAPASLRAKIGLDPGGTRPMVVVLVTFRYPERYTGAVASRLTVSSKDPRTTRISWEDRSEGRVDRAAAPAQSHWYTGVASFLLMLGPATGGSTCERTRNASDSAASPDAASSHSVR